MIYRPEIDGLRAVAVLPVILFHAGFSLFSGGFVGVDVFFVISGYLITSILISELEGGTFSIGRFYERRARRILPALFFVMLCCIPFAWFWLQPPEFKEFSQSLIAVSLFVSNIFFWRAENYFAPTAEENPLLHTWSLAVEEQFYIFFPLLLLALWRFGRNPVFYVVVAASGLSLALAEYGWRNHATANFYLLPTRAWELGAGSICAFLLYKKSVHSSQFLSSAGLGLIGYSILFFDKSVPFPSLYALAPVAGTVLVVLFAAKDTLTAKLLSSRAFVGIGLISFSAYLWHQPLFAFARIRSLLDPSAQVMLALSCASLALAYVSWRWVEQPFRRGGHSLIRSRSTVFAVSSVFTVSFLIFGGYGHISDGSNNRGVIMQRLHKDLYVREFQEECFDFSMNRIESQGFFCKLGNQDVKPSVAIVGDSHLLSFLGPLTREFESREKSFIVSGVSGCPPFIDTYVFRPDDRREVCNFRNFEAFEQLLELGIKKVILISRWTYYSTGDVSGAFLYLGNDYDVPLDQENSRSVFDRKFEQTLRFLERYDFEVVVFHQAPVQKVDARRFYNHVTLFEQDNFRESLEAASLDVLEHQEHYRPLASFIEDKVRSFANARSINFNDRLCSGRKCWIGNSESSYYLDDNHLSNSGAAMVIEDFVTDLM